jgi:IclR family acetate operon transcriptional repressor
MKVINKALDILEVFLSQEDEISLSKLAALSGLNITTVNRIASTLVKRGYLKQREKRGKYSLGTKFLDFSGIIRSRIKIRDVAVPFLTKLSHLVDESAILLSWDGQQGIHTETIHSNHALRVVPDEGTKFSLYSTGVGKAILANITEKEFEEYCNNVTLEQHTPNTITDLNDLKKRLLTIKREGVAFDDEEQYIGIRNVAAVLKDSGGSVVGAIGVLGPTIRLTRARMREITPAVKDCALEISRALGYKGE